VSVPANREEFKAYCLRELGDGVLKINISEEQVDDRVDEALKWFQDYHFEGAEKCYYKYQLTETDITNKYISLPSNIIGAVNIFDGYGLTYGYGDMFNIQYQIALNDLYTLTSVSMVPYFMTLQHLQFVEELLVGKKPIRFNRHQQRLYIDGSWASFSSGHYVVVEAYQVVDPDTFTSVWGDRWLLRYATALIKKNWGSNLKKFQNMQMPGGISFNGQQIYNEAVEEINDIEHEMIHGYGLPVADMIG